MLRQAAILYLLIMTFLGAKAQEAEYMFEIGAGGGLSWAYGDVNRSKLVYKPAPAVDLILCYNANPRLAFVADIMSIGLKGDSRDFDNAFVGDERRMFDNRLWQLTIRPEFHFWSYGWANDYREKRRLAPFITAGLGFGLTSGDGDTGATMNVPFGVGAKWKISPRLNAQATCLFIRTFGDGADGIKDPYLLESSTFANSDWVGALILSITFDFKERCFDCLNKNY